MRRKVVAIVPAWNEADAITGTIRALRRQSRPLDGIVVVANNCTDNTAALARRAGASVVEMPVNPHKKAGAMNYALDLVLPGLDDEDFVLLQDADTTLNPDFAKYAVEAMRPGVGGVCARYDNPAPRNFLERLQASEFTRSRRKISRARGKVLILVGIASLFRVGVLRHVLAAREAGELPGSRTYYNLASLCEDYEMTLAMKTLGYELTSPPRCRPWTHAMPTVAKLRGQRVRWTRGALDDLRVYGWTKVTWTYIMAQVGRCLAMISPLLFAAYLISLQVTYGRIVWDIPWVDGQLPVYRGAGHHCPQGRLEGDAASLPCCSRSCSTTGSWPCAICRGRCSISAMPRRYGRKPDAWNDGIADVGARECSGSWSWGSRFCSCLWRLTACFPGRAGFTGCAGGGYG